MATRGSQGLRLLMSKSVDGVILEYHLGLMDGAPVADEIKQVRPRLPIVMLAKGLDLPEGALKSVDALVTKSDGPRLHLEAPLGREIPIVCLDSKHLPQRSSDESTQATNTDKDRMKKGIP
jgi:CheY-like chemotaxis protein